MADDEDEDDKERPSLRVVQLTEPLQQAQWQATGDNIVAEFLRRHGEDFYYIDADSAFFHWTGALWDRDQSRTIHRMVAAMCRDIAAHKKPKVRSKLESGDCIRSTASRMRDEAAGPIDRFDARNVFNAPDGRARFAVRTLRA